MRRRDLLIAICGAAASRPLAANAQQAAKPARIGYLGVAARDSNPNPQAFFRGLRDLGYIEGRNLVIEYRDAEGKPERFPALAAELVALNVDVIVAGGGTLGALAAKQATITLPIVFLVGDPVADGLVTSLPRPGGNATGLSFISTELTGKLLEMLKQAVPAVNRVALLLKPDAAPERTMQGFRNEPDAAARALGVHLQILEARGPEDFDRAFSDMSEARADALAVLVTGAFSAGDNTSWISRPRTGCRRRFHSGTLSMPGA